MKKLLLSAALVASAFFAQAQENVIKVNILSPIVKTANFSFERAISDNKSVQLGVFYTGFKVGDTKFSGVGVTPEFRFYLTGEGAPQGFYAAPFVRYQNLSLTSPSVNTETWEMSESKATLNTIGGGVIAGKHWIFGDVFSLDLFFGPSYSAGTLKVEDGGNEDSFELGSFDGFGLRTGVTLGFAF